MARNTVKESSAIEIIRESNVDNNVSNSDRVSAPEKNEKKSIMSDKDFINEEVNYSINYLYENEVGNCEPNDPTECRPYRAGNSDSHKFDEKCFLARRDCKENSFHSVTPEELLVIFTPEQVVHYLIEREKTENYIKNPISNGVDMFDQNWYELKLKSLYLVNGLSTESD